MPRIFAATVLCLLACGCSSTPEPAPEPAPVVDGTLPVDDQVWGVLAPLGHGEPEPRAAGVDRFGTYLDVLRAMRAESEIDPKLWAVIKRIAGNMDQVDLRGLYDMIPAEPDEQGVKTFGIKATRVEDKYKIVLARSAGLLGEGVGDYVSGATLRQIPGKDEESFKLGLGMFFQINTGPTRPAQVALAVSEALRWLERGARLPAPDGPPASDDPGLEREDLSILHRLAGSLPQTYPKLLRLMHVRDVARTERRGRALVTQVQIILEPNLERLETDYPKIHEYLTQRKTMRESRMVVHDAKGRPLLGATYDGPNLRVILRAALHDGKFVPLGGTSVEPGLDVNKRGDQALEARLDVKMSYWGLKIELDDWRIPIVFRHTGKAITGTYRIKNLPRQIKVSGRLFGVVPAWLVDILIPSNLEEIIRGFLQTLIKGDDGAGMRLEFRYETHSPERNVYSVAFEGELANNGFVQVQSKLVKARVAPRKKARSEIGDLLAQLVELLRRDLLKYRERVLAAAPSAAR